MIAEPLENFRHIRLLLWPFNFAGLSSAYSINGRLKEMWSWLGIFSYFDIELRTNSELNSTNRILSAGLWRHHMILLYRHCKKNQMMNLNQWQSVLKPHICYF